jgi:hypothetical protein
MRGPSEYDILIGNTSGKGGVNINFKESTHNILSKLKLSFNLELIYEFLNKLYLLFSTKFAYTNENLAFLEVLFPDLGFSSMNAEIFDFIRNENVLKFHARTINCVPKLKNLAHHNRLQALYIVNLINSRKTILIEFLF